MKQTHCKRGHEFTPENTCIQHGGYRLCIACRQLREANYGGSGARQKKWRKLHRAKHLAGVRQAHIRRDFGMTVTEYETKLKLQNNLCALCEKPFYGKGSVGTAPVLDHNHGTGKTRDFIHSMCNKGIGHFNEDVVVLRLAIVYLEKHNDVQKQSTGSILQHP